MITLKSSVTSMQETKTMVITNTRCFALWGTIELDGFIMKAIMEEEACCPCGTKKLSVMKVM